MRDTLPNDGSKYDWSFLVVKAAYVSVGICLDSLVTATNFKYDETWRTPGHGHYSFKSTAYQLSHSEAALNYQTKSFKYKQGEVVRCTYDSSDHRLTAEVVSDGRKNTLECVAPGNRDSYRICAFVGSVGDSVEFLTNERN